MYKNCSRISCGMTECLPEFEMVFGLLYIESMCELSALESNIISMDGKLLAKN